MAYTRDTMTKELAEDLIAQYGGQTAAAAAIVHECADKDGRAVSLQAVRCWLQDAITGRLRRRLYDAPEKDKLNRIAELLERAGIDVASIGKIEKAKIKAWGVHAKVKTRDPKTGKVLSEKIVKDGLHSTELVVSPSWEEGPAWPLMQPAAPVKIAGTPYIARPRLVRTIVVISDTQIGFLRHVETGDFTPIHDSQAIDVALQVVADLQPDQIGYVGDYLDLPEMSRWLQHEEFWRTTQPAINEGHKILAQFEAAAGPRERRLPTQFVAGNHDRRLREYIVKNARAAFNLRPATETPTSWPDLTIPHLLRFDELGVEYIGEYPGGEWWITPELVVRHNPESKSAYSGSVIAGHTHRVRSDTISRRTPFGPQHFTSYEIGCLCSLSNYSDNRSLLASRVPSGRGFVKDWQQGFAIVHVDDDGDFSVEQVRINNGKAIYAGRVYKAA